MLNLDTIFELIAPHQCIACGIEGEVLCTMCLANAGGTIQPRCAGCMRLSKNSKTCQTCKSWLNIYAIYVATLYEGIYEQMIRSFKFNVRRQTAIPMAKMLYDVIPSDLPDGIIVSPLPTAPSRIRQRGFDHATLLAKKLVANLSNSKEAPWNGCFRALLGRKTNIRQLGSSRSQRIEQMKNEFFVPNPQQVAGKQILLVDDVMTTGASISAAAKVLKEAGAKRIYATIFAQKT